MFEKIVLIIELIMAALITFFLIPLLKKFAKRRHLLGKDMYKVKETYVAEMGGLAILIGYSMGLLTTLYFIIPELKFQLLAALSSALFIGIVGVFDDLFALMQREKILLPLFAAIPLIFARSGITKIWIPFIGSADVGLFYTLILIPLGIMVASNLTNMLAGFNGLEAGLGLITSITIAIVAIIQGKTYVLLIILPLIGALLAFLYFNWYPAKIFPGDTGTLMIGCVIAIAVIVGNMEMIGVYAMSLYIINFLMYIIHLKLFLPNNWKFGIVDNEGYIHPPDKRVRFGAITYMLSYYFKLKEKGLVLSIIGIQTIICIFIIVFSI